MSQEGQNGRDAIPKKKLSLIVEACGYTMDEYFEYLDGKPIPINWKKECLSIVKSLANENLRTAHTMIKVLFGEQGLEGPISIEAKILKFFRLNAKPTPLSIKALAQTIKVDPSYITHIEKGKFKIIETRILQIVEACGYTMEEFLTYKNLEIELPEDHLNDSLSMLKNLCEDKMTTAYTMLSALINPEAKRVT